MYVEASAPFEAAFDFGVSGLVGTVAVKVIDNDGVNVIGPTTVGITEDGVSGIYIWNAPAAPAVVGQYSIIWSGDGLFTSTGGMGVDELVIVPIGTSDLPPISGGADGSDTAGPCSAWTTSDDVLACCNVVAPDPVLLDNSIVASSQLLYEAGGHQHPGVCTQTVRPCQTDDCRCGYQVLSRGHLVGWDESCWGGFDCGCRPLSRVKLAGHARTVTEVKLDGVVVDPATYRLDESFWLTRTNGLRWPSCQSLDLADTEDGTFSVTYSYGKIPPLAAQQAARQLACEVVKSCAGDEECALPTGTTRVTRQGITIERSFLARDPNGIWRSGLALVDLYLNTFNPHGLRREAIFWSASRSKRFARPA